MYKQVKTGKALCFLFALFIHYTVLGTGSVLKPETRIQENPKDTLQYAAHKQDLTQAKTFFLRSVDSMHINPVAALSYANQSILLAQKSQFRQLEAQALEQAGYLHEKLADFPNAVFKYTQALKIYQALHAYSSMARCLYYLEHTSNYYMQNEANTIDSAIQTLAQAITLHPFSKAELALINLIVGSHYFEQQQWLEAKNYLWQAIHSGIKKYESQAALALSNLYRYTGHTDSSAYYQKLAYNKALQAADSTMLLASYYLFLAKRFNEQIQEPASLRYLQTAKTYFDRVDQPSNQESFYLNYVSVLVNQGHYKQAVNIFNQGAGFVGSGLTADYLYQHNTPGYIDALSQVLAAHNIDATTAQKVAILVNQHIKRRQNILTPALYKAASPKRTPNNVMLQQYQKALKQQRIIIALLSITLVFLATGFVIQWRKRQYLKRTLKNVFFHVRNLKKSIEP